MRVLLQSGSGIGVESFFAPADDVFLMDAPFFAC